MPSWLVNDELSAYRAAIFNDNRPNVEIVHTLDLMKLAHAVFGINLSDDTDTTHLRLDRRIKHRIKNIIQSSRTNTALLNRKLLLVQYVAECCFVLCIKWEDNMRLARENTKLILELCLWMVKLFMKAGKDSFFVYNKIVMINQLLSSLGVLNSFYDELLTHNILVMRNTAVEICHLRLKRALSSVRLGQACEHILSYIQTHLVLAFNYACFYEHPSNVWSGVTRSVDSSIASITELMHFLQTSFEKQMNHHDKQNMKLVWRSIELMESLNDYLIWNRVYELDLERQVNVRQRLERDIMIQMDALSAESAKSSSQCLINTCLLQYFFERMFNDQEFSITAEASIVSFYTFQLTMAKHHFDSYLRFFNLNQINLSRDLAVSNGYFLSSFRIFNEIKKMLFRFNELRIRDHRIQNHLDVETLSMVSSLFDTQFTNLMICIQMNIFRKSRLDDLFGLLEESVLFLHRTVMTERSIQTWLHHLDTFESTLKLLTLTMNLIMERCVADYLKSPHIPYSGKDFFYCVATILALCIYLEPNQVLMTSEYVDNIAQLWIKSNLGTTSDLQSIFNKHSAILIHQTTCRQNATRVLSLLDQVDARLNIKD